MFLRKLVAGGANRSYGIDVARLAGLPRSVLARAREVLAEARSAPRQRPPSPAFPLAAGSPPPVPTAPSVPAPLLAALTALSPDHLTPMQALAALVDLKRLLP